MNRQAGNHPHPGSTPPVRSSSLAAPGLAALGIVFGDIGTSPLYTLKTILSMTPGTPTNDVVLGVLSLIIWTLIIITSVKYVAFAMSIDNDGEGGVLALMSLLGTKKHQRPIIVAIGLFGAALIYGDVQLHNASERRRSRSKSSCVRSNRKIFREFPAPAFFSLGLRTLSHRS
jgi:KUP system potassium uptake protein